MTATPAQRIAHDANSVYTPPATDARRNESTTTSATSTARWTALRAVAVGATLSLTASALVSVAASAAASPIRSSTSSTALSVQKSTPPCVTNRQGIPSSGAYVGAAVGGTQNIAGLEKKVGRTLALHRTYYNANQVTAALRTVHADLAAHRLPWISFKMPYSWAAMAGGRGDTWARALSDRLAKVGGPVWLAFHHEPEGDGNLVNWTRMQRHLAPIVHARTANVAYTAIFTGWDAFFGPAKYSVNRLWPGRRYVDVLGVDMYNNFGTSRGRVGGAPQLNTTKFFAAIGPWARAHRVTWALGETGYTAAAARNSPTWLAQEYRALVAQGGRALTYFDSSRNSIANWTLSDSIRLNQFKSTLVNSRRFCR
jgi:hypothetical protein